MEFLPEVLIGDILARLPVKCLVRFKCVCKRWLSLISDPQFVNLHLQRAFEVNNTNNNSNDYCKISRRRVLLATSVLRSMDYKFDDDDDDCAVLEFDDDDDDDCTVVKDPDFPLRSSEDRILGSCNGLVCMYVYPNNFFLWNPSTRESKELPKSRPYKLFSCFGFGYDSSIDDYKVVCASNSHSRYETKSKVEVFTLKTNTWRTIQGFKLNCMGFDGNSGALCNGALHWTAYPWYNTGRDEGQAIVSFDLASEKFQEVPRPDDNARFEVLGVLGGCLSLVRFGSTRHVEVWLMKEYHVKTSWTKLSTMPCETSADLRPLCFSNDGQIVMAINGNKLVRFEPKEKTISNLVTFKEKRCLEAALYVESLVSPNGNGCGTDKQCQVQKKRRKKKKKSKRKHEMKS